MLEAGGPARHGAALHAKLRARWIDDSHRSPRHGGYVVTPPRRMGGSIAPGRKEWYRRDGPLRVKKGGRGGIEISRRPGIKGAGSDPAALPVRGPNRDRHARQDGWPSTGRSTSISRTRVSRTITFPSRRSTVWRSMTVRSFGASVFTAFQMWPKNSPSDRASGFLSRSRENGSDMDRKRKECERKRSPGESQSPRIAMCGLSRIDVNGVPKPPKPPWPAIRPATGPNARWTAGRAGPR